MAIRVGLFVIGVCTASVCLGDSAVPPAWLLLPAVLFAALVPLHSRCVRRLQRSNAAADFHRGCLERLQDNWRGRPHTGLQYLESAHPWVQDLDIFGPGSLFQLVTECRTGPGHARLAGWMKQTADPDTIATRQVRAEALRGELELRESLAMVSDSASWTLAERLLRDWVPSPPERIAPWILWCSGLLGLAAIPIAIGVLSQTLHLYHLLLVMLLQAPLVLITRRQIQHVSTTMDSVDQALRQLAEVLILFERHSFEEASVRNLQRQLCGRGAEPVLREPASRSIRRLSSLTRWLNHSLRNQFFAPIAWMCGLLVLLTDRLERWRQQHGRDVGRWLDATAEFEALLSVAAFRFEHPEYCNPTVTTDPIEFAAEQLGHPLLSAEQCVRNDLRLTSRVPLMLISGSNMSGKSTLLRAVGTNLVLTFCGASVNARRLTTYPFQLATAMRISDSLQEGRSLFFSVVQRLKAVVDLTQGDRTVLFLLDEILHGTNSHDRRRGAEAVIRSLVDRHALGIVTTHDLALTQIVDSLAGRGVNCHFEDRVTDGRMTFDYVLREGVVQRSNALELMRMLGLDV